MGDSDLHGMTETLASIYKAPQQSHGTTKVDCIIGHNVVEERPGSSNMLGPMRCEVEIPLTGNPSMLMSQHVINSCIDKSFLTMAGNLAR